MNADAIRQDGYRIAGPSPDHLCCRPSSAVRSTQLETAAGRLHVDPEQHLAGAGVKDTASVRTTTATRHM